MFPATAAGDVSRQKLDKQGANKFNVGHDFRYADVSWLRRVVAIAIAIAIT
jgi:hypothetical protein